MLKKIKTKDYSINDTFNIFETECQIRGLSSETIRWYKETLYYFSKFYNINNHISKLNDEVIKQYIIYCLEMNYKKSTINTRLTALKSFLNWCFKNGYINKKVQVNLLKNEKDVKETYTKIELEKILKKPNLKNCLFTEYRDWVISNFFLSTACRVSTLINIKISDIDLQEREIIYKHIKNKKQQIIPLTLYMTNILKEYLKYRKGTVDDFLFCNKYGEQLTTNAVRIALNKYNRKRGVNRTGRHIYRNTFAKLWILNGGDAFRLQKMLGHSTIDMTKRYIEMYSDDLKIDFESYNPINNFLKKEKKQISMKNKI